MCYLYTSELFCDDCGRIIERALFMGFKATAEQMGSVDIPDGTTCHTTDDIADCLGSMYEYDSDDYPKYRSDDNESDGPQHCASGADCVNAVEEIGCGALIGTTLTDYGVDYVKEVVRDGGAMAEFWRDEFSWIGFEG